MPMLAALPAFVRSPENMSRDCQRLSYLGQALLFAAFGCQLAKEGVMRFNAIKGLLFVCVVGLGAVPCASAAESAADQAAAALAKGNVEQAVAAYTKSLKETDLANDRRAVILNDRAVAYVRLGQVRRALEDYNKALELFAEYPAAYNNRGNLLLSLGHPKEAIKDFNRAILLAPKYGVAFSNRANARLRLRAYREAVADFTKSIELLPGTAAPLSGRGVAFLSGGKPHAAIRDFSRAVKADTSFASAYRNRAEARMNIQQSQEAVEDLTRAIAFDPNSSDNYVLRGYGYLMTGNIDAAITDFTAAIERNVRLASAYQARGLAYGLSEKYDEAFADLNQAIELDPRSAIAFAFRGFIYKQTDRFDIAEKDVQAALRLDKRSPEAIWVRGTIAEAGGQADAAVKYYRAALAIKPGWQLASDGLRRLGAGTELTDETDVPGLGLDDQWRVVVRGTSFTAIKSDNGSVRVPLEMLGQGKPKLLAWDIQAPPYQRYGILRYASGKVPSGKGEETVATEQAALIDLVDEKVIAIQPHRKGSRVANWTWNDGLVRIAAIDGVTDEFELKMARPKVSSAGARRGGYADDGGQWAPWDQPFAGPRDSNRRARKRRKPKTIFDLLFN